MSMRVPAGFVGNLSPWPTTIGVRNSAAGGSVRPVKGELDQQQ